MLVLDEAQSVELLSAWSDVPLRVVHRYDLTKWRLVDDAVAIEPWVNRTEERVPSHGIELLEKAFVGVTASHTLMA